MPIILTPLTLIFPWAHCDYGQTSDDCGKHIMYSIQEALLAWFPWTEVQTGVTVSVFRSVVQVCYAEEGMGGGGGQRHFSDLDVNDKISWSCVRDQFQQIIFKRDSSKQYSFFLQLPISEKPKAPSAHGLQMALWTKKKEQKRQNHFSLYLGFLEFSNYSKALIKTLGSLSQQ